MEKTFTTKSPEETERIAAELAATLRAGSVLAMYGDLGAGKTCFIRGLASGLGATRAVHSPTFTLINEYPGRLTLFHMDLYRIRDADEALDFGLDEYLHGEGICAIEWAERVESLLPPHSIRVTMRLGDEEDSRCIRIEQQEALTT